MSTRKQSNDEDQLPVGQHEDVEYADELADHDDREAQARAAAADRRQSEQA